jgi:hypothetical protein
MSSDEAEAFSTIEKYCRTSHSRCVAPGEGFADEGGVDDNVNDDDEADDDDDDDVGEDFDDDFDDEIDGDFDDGFDDDDTDADSRNVPISQSMLAAKACKVV